MIDIKEKIEEIVDKVKGDKNFAAKFTSDPVKAVESVIGIDLPDDQINPIIEGVKAKLSLDSAGDALGSLTSLF
jgi:predicted RNA-binding protein with EMAP domain